MSLGYLLSPIFQSQTTSGKPNTGGYIEVYLAGSRTKYFCSSDFNGTLHPFRIPLDSLGSNIVLADESHSYDVYVYNRYGSLLMSRYNVSPGGAGGASFTVLTSSDGSIEITQTEDGYDIKVADNHPSVFIGTGLADLATDDFFKYERTDSVGDDVTLNNDGRISLKNGWYHFDVQVQLTWNGTISNDTSPIEVYAGHTKQQVDFDFSYPHSDTVNVSGELHIASLSSYVSYDQIFNVGVVGMNTGMTAKLIEVGLFKVTAIVGNPTTGVNPSGKVHRLLRWYTNASEADGNHPVGDWLHDLDAEDPDDPSGHPMVTADQLFDWYEAGQNFELYEVGGTNGQLGWSAVYRMVTWQDQSAWWSQFAPVPGKACRLEFFRMGMYATPYRGGLIAYIRYKDEDYMRLYEVMPGQSIWMAEYQEKLPYYASDWHAGDILRVKTDGSGLEWVNPITTRTVTVEDL